MAVTAQPTGLALKRRRGLPWYLEVWVRLVREKPLGAVGAVLVLALLLTAVFADVLAPYNYEDTESAALLGFSLTHPLGTDNLGRDMLSRIIYGARVSMYVSLGSVAWGGTVAVILGLLTGYVGGKLDLFIQRVVDAWMSFPSLVIVLTLMSILGPGLLQVIFTIGLGFSFGNSRVVRSTVLSVKENLYIDAARAIGASPGRIVLVHVLPNVMAPIIILITLTSGIAILIESSLSFLGFGVPPPHPSWGGMLSGAGREYMYLAPWMAVWPGVAISLAVFGFNMLGDALRDLLDPRLRGAGILR